MPRAAKKPEEETEKPKEGATLSIDVDSFVRTRDSVVTGLATLQDAIQTLSSAYIKHTNAVLGQHGVGLDVDSTLAKLAENPLLILGGDLNRAISPAKSVAAEPDKKERKKRQHDPNAPKRPLTPFFLYMQTARPIIASDLGPETAKKNVSSEGTRRWAAMAPQDKQLWTNVYKDNLRLYNARMHYYKATGSLDAKDMSDQDAANYADENNIDDPADAQLVSESAAIFQDEDAEGHDDGDDAEGEPEPEPEPREPTPPPKTPKLKNGRKTKASKSNTPAAPAAPPSPPSPPSPEAIVPPTSASSIVPPKSAEKEKSAEKKRKRSGKKEELIAEKEEVAVETPKNAAKSRKKKAKADS
ncbi:hypothetical protein QTJ16_003457 [Diplocarpon rosae]|uniref:HMG box domain-containing protein n=1 Tax=Diplocarpon rosae TaxID=946125 RepID=A0AAD9T1F2_9HELO|nr:hypothetical protein QTJ16_003457 [Diplocarpon rosae]